MKFDIDRAYDNSLKSINKWVKDEANMAANSPAGGNSSKPINQLHQSRPSY